MSEKFSIMCQKARTTDDLIELINYLVNTDDDNFYGYKGYSYKGIYNRYIGWGVPSEKALKIIYDKFQDHLIRFPDARLIDVGAGTGLYSALLHRMGIPKEKMIALDLEERTHRPKEVTHDFYPIVTSVDIKPIDALLIVWGCGCDKIVDKYAKTGTCVIVQGEGRGGCTYPTDWINPRYKYDSESESESEFGSESESESDNAGIPNDDKHWTVSYSDSLYSLVSVYSEHISCSTSY